MQPKHFFTLIFVLMLFPPQGIAQTSKIEYPETPMDDISDCYFGTEIKDQYRWLENTDSSQTIKWVKKQDKLTDEYLDQIPFRRKVYDKIKEYAFFHYKCPIKNGKYYFTRAVVSDKYGPALLIQDSIDNPPEILVHPKDISTKDNILLLGFYCSKESDFIAYKYSRNGSDWHEIEILRMPKKKKLKDHLKNVIYSTIAWKDSGFYYCTYDRGPIGTPIKKPKLYYHKLGTKQEKDSLIYENQENPEANLDFMVTDDERYLYIEDRNNNTKKKVLYYIDFSEGAFAKLNVALSDYEFSTNFLGNFDNKLVFLTDFNAPQKQVMTIQPGPVSKIETLIPQKDALLMNARIIGNKIVTLYQKELTQYLIIFSQEGQAVDTVEFGFPCTIGGLTGTKDDNILLFHYQTYTNPPIVYSLNLNNNILNLKARTTTTYHFDNYETYRDIYQSFDGTWVPIYISRKKGTVITDYTPVILSAYGGFGIINSPHFDPGIIFLLDQGGVYVNALIRGGGEKGKSWHDAGRGYNKITSLKDFICAAEYLINNKFVNPKYLAITGGSNGGLVTGWAMVKRPELFKVAIPIVGVYDMLRYENFANAHMHSSEYASVKDSLGFVSLRSCSPLHNIDPAKLYPASLIMTSDNDTRVPPLHSYKFAAALQAVQENNNPILLKTERNAGHYGGINYTDYIQNLADMYSFMFYNMGIKPSGI